MKDKIEEFFELALIDNPGTKRSYRSYIKRYMKLNKMDANTYFVKNQPYEKHIKNFWEYLKNKSPSSKNVGISAVKAFLARFDKKTKTLDIWDDISVRMKGTLSVPITPKHVPDRSELKIIFQYCDIRTKAAVMMSITSGCRIGEITKLEPDDIYFNETPTKINIRPEVAKNKRRRITFISPEATELLKEWLRVREEYTKNSLKRMNFHYQQHLKIKDDKRIFPVNQFNIRRQFNVACDKAGFSKKHKQKGDFDHTVQRSRRELTFHHLRDFFRTYLGNSDLAEHLMGHSGYLSTYRQFNDKELARLYMENVQNVTIFERTPDLTEVNEEMNSIKDENKELKEMVKMMELRMQGLENKLEIEKIKNGNK